MMFIKLLCFIAIFIITTNCASEVITTAVRSIPSKRSSILEISQAKDIPKSAGFWKTKQEWRPYWVKDWVVKKIYVPVWKHVWGPAQVREWIPTGIAKPHPGIKHTTIIH